MHAPFRAVHDSSDVQGVTMKTYSVSRRQVLRGAGGVSLGLPLLPSLFPRRADGAEPSLTGDKFFVAAATQHGAIGESSMYPAASALTQSKEINPGHMAKYGPLTSRIEGNDRVVSGVLRAPSSKFPEKLVAKMNVMRGFDFPYYIGHHTGGHLGNFVRSDQGPQNLIPFATIDQFMAWSPKFYKTTAGIKQRSIVTGQNFAGMSFGYANPANQSGGIEKVEVDGSSNSLFDRLVAGVGTKPVTPSAPPRKLIVDHVLENYRSLKTGNRRLSKDDKVRLDNHLGRLDELNRRLSTTNVMAMNASCADYKKPAAAPGGNMESPSVATKYFNVLNEVVSMAFACGTSRVATMYISSPFYDYTGSWHQDTAHQWEKPDAQMRLVGALRNAFEGAIVDLAARLDSIEIAPGVTILDQSLYQWTQESGWSTHDAQDMPIVTFGKAGGYFKTGQYVDFRNTGSANAHLDIFGRQKQLTGLWHRQWLATALQSMGIPPADFEKGGKTGYGDPTWAAAYDKAVHPNVINRASDPIQIIT
jgi:hypothetical protein